MNKFNILLFEGGEKCMMNEMIELNESNEMTNKGANHMKKKKQLLKNQKGMTLIELLAVIVILAIVAAIAVPAIGNIINNSKDKAILADASNILAGAKLAMTDGACKTTENECSNTELQPYVDGITLGTEDKVVKGTNTWTVTYDNLKNIKNTDKFTVAASDGIAAYTPPATSIEEKSLNKAMNQ